MAAVQRISTAEAQKRFEAFGLPDCRLRNVTDLKVVFGHDVSLLKGYQDLTDEQKRLFGAFICTYYNSVGMGLKCGFIPKSIHYVEKITYCVSRPADEWNESPYKEVCAVQFNIILPGGKIRKMKLHISYPDIPAEYWIETARERFLRFDYKDGRRMDWLHVVGPDKWY